MAANSILVQNAMSVNYRTGTDTKGKDVYRKQTFKNLNVDATDDEIISLTEAIQKVFEYTISTIKKEQGFVVVKN